MASGSARGAGGAGAAPAQVLSTLSPDEALKLNEAVGPELAVLGSCIARLYVCNPSPTATKQAAGSALNRFPGIRKGRWMATQIAGALALVMHRPSSSLYFMLFHHRTWALLFDYELYYDIEYKELSDHFHCFEMDDLMAGLCIASAVTAKAFFIKVKMMAPKQGVSVAKLLGTGVEKAAAKQAAKQAGASAPAVRVGADGSIVTDAMWLPDGTLNVENIPKAWKKLLQSAGFTKGDLRDPGMKLLIVACLEDCGISAQAPPRDLTEDEQAAFYSPEERRRYEQYKRDMQTYEAAMQKYDDEMRAYEAWQREQAGLAQWAAAMAEQQAAQQEAEQQQQHQQQAEQHDPPQQRRRSLSKRLADTFLGPAPPKPARTGAIALQPQPQQPAATVPHGAGKGPPPPMPPRDVTPPRPKQPDRISQAPQVPALPVIPLEVLEERAEYRDEAGEGLQESPESQQLAQAHAAPPPPPPSKAKRTTFFGLVKQKAPVLRPPSARADKSAPQTAGAALRPKSRAFVAEVRDKGASAGAHLKKPALPDLGSVNKVTQESLVDKLRQRLADRRGVIHVEADDDWGNLDE
jgi:hypothetical protein